jgi:hypothetical protein
MFVERFPDARTASPWASNMSNMMNPGSTAYIMSQRKGTGVFDAQAEAGNNNIPQGHAPMLEMPQDALMFTGLPSEPGRFTQAGLCASYPADTLHHSSMSVSPESIYMHRNTPDFSLAQGNLLAGHHASAAWGAYTGAIPQTQMMAPEGLEAQQMMHYMMSGGGGSGADSSSWRGPTMRPDQAATGAYTVMPQGRDCLAPPQAPLVAPVAPTIATSTAAKQDTSSSHGQVQSMQAAAAAPFLTARPSMRDTSLSGKIDTGASCADQTRSVDVDISRRVAQYAPPPPQPLPSSQLNATAAQSTTMNPPSQVNNVNTKDKVPPGTKHCTGEGQTTEIDGPVLLMIHGHDVVEAPACRSKGDTSGKMQNNKGAGKFCEKYLALSLSI